MNKLNKKSRIKTILQIVVIIILVVLILMGISYVKQNNFYGLLDGKSQQQTNGTKSND